MTQNCTDVAVGAFVLSIPRLRSKGSTPQVGGDMTVMDTTQKKILVIEDEPVFRTTLAAFLQRRNHLVYQAENGQQGLAAMAVFQPDLVLCDLKMPGMDGHQVIQCISRRFPDKPIIVISGQANLEDVSRALRAGAQDYLLKPITHWQALDHAIRDVLSHTALAQRQLGELNEHLKTLQKDDLASTQLLQAMAPPSEQTLASWHTRYQTSSPLLIPEFMLLDGQLLLVVMELSFSGTEAAFVGATIRFLLNGPYRQYQQGESRLLASPGSILEYLNWNLYESGLGALVNMAVILFSADDEKVRFANAGLQAPAWLQYANGLPLGMMRQSGYPTVQRVLRKPCHLQFTSDSGAALTIDVTQ